MEQSIKQAPVYADVLVKLLQGPVYLTDKEAWALLIQHQRHIRDYFAQLAVNIHLDEVEGYAFLKPLSEEQEEAWKENQHTEPPRLITRRRLTYIQTLLLVLLRKALLDHDAMRGESRLILTRDAIQKQVSVFLPHFTNQVKLQDTVDSAINAIDKLGILRKLATDEDSFEVSRILKARITPAELEEIEATLKSLTP